MCLQKRYSKVTTGLVRLFLLFRPHVYKMVYQTPDGEMVPPYEGRQTDSGIMAYDPHDWQFESDYRPYGYQGAQWDRVTPRLHDLRIPGREYQVGFHCFVFRKAAQKACMNLMYRIVRKVKVGCIRAAGWQDGMCVVVGQMRFV